MAAMGSKLRTLADNIVAFRCPGCETMHQVWTDRWAFNGDGDCPTFSPSVFVNPPEKAAHVPSLPSCHSFVRDGRIQFLSDCTHPLAGQTVDLPNINDRNEGN